MVDGIPDFGTCYFNGVFDDIAIILSGNVVAGISGIIFMNIFMLSHKIWERIRKAMCVIPIHK